MADDVGNIVGPVIGLGLGLIALKAIDRTINPDSRRRYPSRYVVKIKGRVHRRYKYFEDARREADRLRNKGTRGVTVHEE